MEEGFEEAYLKLNETYSEQEKLFKYLDEYKYPNKR
jgi:hypothetical protein